MLQGFQISYRGKSYRVQNANGWQHIIVTQKGKRTRIGVTEINKPPENDYVYNYIFAGGFMHYPCPAMDYWIYRHRLGHKVTVEDYKKKFHIKKEKKRIK